MAENARNERHPGPPDVNEVAFSIVSRATAEKPDEIAAADVTQPLFPVKRGEAGGKARAASMTAEERSESARKAAQARWHPEAATAQP